jgi:hypothetical protein
MELKMKGVKSLLFIVILCSLVLIIGACNGIKATEGAIAVSELMEDPIYDTEVIINGEVGLLGELFCPCFELTSGGETILVWYGLMVEDNGTERPTASTEGIENGDQVIVTGELKLGGIYHSLNDFWARDVEKVD